MPKNLDTCEPNNLLQGNVNKLPPVLFLGYGIFHRKLQSERSHFHHYQIMAPQSMRVRLQNQEL